MLSKNSFGRTARNVVLLSAVATLVACESHHTTLEVAASAPSARTVPSATPTSPSRARLRELTRMVARAMSDPSVRAFVKADMRASRVTVEHKLSLQRFTQTANGQAMTAVVARLTGVARDSVERLLASAPALEFYMPIDAHRESWTGTGDVIVASYLTDEDVPVAYDQAGVPQDLTMNSVPATPTFVLAPVESDFDAPLPESNLKNTNDSHGASIGTWGKLIPEKRFMVACEDECSGGGGTVWGNVPATAPTGLYMTYSDLLDLKEPWLRGDPEVEVHVIGPDEVSDATHYKPLTCASASSAGSRRFDQNGNSWSGYVLLLDEQQMVSWHFSAEDPNPRQYNVAIWEDDDVTCEVRDSPTRFQNGLINAGAYAAAAGFLLTQCGAGAVEPNLCAIGVYTFAAYSIAFLWHTFETNDDFIGTAYEASTATNAGYSSRPSTNFTLVDDNTNTTNGGMRLVAHKYGTTN